MAIRKTWNGSEWITNGQESTATIRYDINQNLTDSEKQQAQKNIGTEIETNITSSSTNTKVAGAKSVYDYHDSTKYDASNPAGYTTNTGTVTSVAINMNGQTKGTVTTSGTIDLGTVITSHQDISGKENISNKSTTITSSSTDTQYPSAKAVYDALQDVGGAVEDVTVNGTSVVVNKVAQVIVPQYIETTLDDYLENESTYALTNNIYFVGGTTLTDVSTEAR